jgi:hypothetical protein
VAPWDAGSVASLILGHHTGIWVHTVETKVCTRWLWGRQKRIVGLQHSIHHTQVVGLAQRCHVTIGRLVSHRVGLGDGVVASENVHCVGLPAHGPLIPNHGEYHLRAGRAKVVAIARVKIDQHVAKASEVLPGRDR